MRAYFFGNMYLSSIQQGIQAQHCTTEIFNKYFPRPTFVGEKCCFTASEQLVTLCNWSHDHKVDILLNAGYSSTLHEIYELMGDDENPYPYAKFHESEEALDGALTCVGIMLPDAIYDTAFTIRNTRGREGADMAANLNQYGEFEDPDTGAKYFFTEFQVWIINEINKYGLAK